MRKWTKNEEMDREWGKGQRMRKWAENEEMEREPGNGERMRKLRGNRENMRKLRERISSLYFPLFSCPEQLNR